MSATITKKRKTLTGVVTSKSGDKTVKVTCFYKIPHPVYKKEINCKTVMLVHDEKNICCVGDKVEVMHTRPQSKRKCWIIVAIIEKSPLSL